MGNIYRISPRQKEDWEYNYKLGETQSPRVMSIEVELKNLDVDAFTKAYKMLILENESLRTMFPVIKGQIFQKVSKYNSEFDLIHLKESEIKTLKGVLKTTILKMKNIVNGPHIRGFIYEKIDSTYIVCILIHHIVSDYWSIRIIKRKLINNYNGIINNIFIPQTEIQKQLGEYITTNYGYFHKSHDQIIKNWIERLSNKQWQINFDDIYISLTRRAKDKIFDFSGLNWQGLTEDDMIRNPNGESYIYYLDKQNYQHLNVYKLSNRKSTNNILLACLNILGVTLTGNHVILIQTHFMNRNDSSLDIIGNFIGKILMLNRITDSQTVNELIEQCNLSFFDGASKIIYNSSSFSNLEIATRCFLFYNFISKEMSEGMDVNIQQHHFLSGVRAESPLVCKVLESNNTIKFEWTYHLCFFSRSAIETITIIFMDIFYKLIVKKEPLVKNLLF